MDGGRHRHFTDSIRQLNVASEPFMSNYQILAVLSGFVLFYSLVGTRLQRTPFSGALIYVIAGFLCGPSATGLVKFDIEAEGISWIAELTLAVVLFSDSANANLAVLRRVEAVPFRLLLIGLPLSIALGYGIGQVLFDGLSVYAVAIMATMLAPTDAALGKAVVTNESVPPSVRESLNVESGLNDGICVPVLLFFLYLAAGELSQEEAVRSIYALPIQQIGVGALVGLTVSFLGTLAMRFCVQREWTTGTWDQMPVIALAFICFAVAQMLGGSGFISSFCGGFLFGRLAGEKKQKYLESAEGTGDALAMITWFVFGTVVVAECLQSIRWNTALYAILSLTVVRMLPVYLATAGLKWRTDTRLFIGWFGPRGLASIVFAVMVLDAKIAGADTLVAVTSLTILLSVIAHGLSATPLATLYSKRLKATDLEEHP